MKLNALAAAVAEINRLLHHGRVDVQVTAVRVKRIVEPGKTPLRGDPIRHAPSVGGPGGDAAKIPGLVLRPQAEMQLLSSLVPWQ